MEGAEHGKVVVERVDDGLNTKDAPSEVWCLDD